MSATRSEGAAGVVTFVGACTYDAIALVDHFPQPDERLVAQEVAFAGGGPAATAAVAFARLGLQAVFVGVVGDDAAGVAVRAGLESAGVDTAGLAVVPGATQSSVIVVDGPNATRAILTRGGPTPQQLAEAVGAARDVVEAAPWVHVDHAGWSAVRSLLQPRTTTTPRICVDAGNPVPGLVTGEVDLFVPTLEALARQYGDRPEEELVEAALAEGARVVVATRGARGARAGTAEGLRVEVPGARVAQVRSTLGAGDVFHGALLAAVVRQMPLTSCLAYANTVAALSCRGLDGRSAIPDHEEALAAVTSSATQSLPPTSPDPLTSEARPLQETP